MNVRVPTATGTTTPADNRPPLVTPEQLATDHAAVLAAVANLRTQFEQALPVVEDDDDIGALGAVVKDIRAEWQRIEATREDARRDYLDAQRIVNSFFNEQKETLSGFMAELEARQKVYLDKKADRERARQEEIARQAQAESDRLAEAARKAAAESKPVEAEVAAQASQRAEATAVEAQELSQAKPAELARTRTPTGTATLGQDWKFEITDLAKIDLEALRPYLPRGDLEKAIRAFVKVNKGDKPLAGVRVFATTKVSNR